MEPIFKDLLFHTLYDTRDEQKKQIIYPKQNSSHTVNAISVKTVVTHQIT